MKNKLLFSPTRMTSSASIGRLVHDLSLRTLGTVGLALLLGHTASAQTILGSTGNYAVMGGGTVTVTGLDTTLTGNLGAGLLVGSVNFASSGTVVSPLSGQNTTDFTRAFTGLNSMTGAVNLTGSDLGVGANNLTPGVYKYTAAAAMTGNLVLDALGQANAVWVFQMASTFGTTAGTSVTFIHTVGDPVANYGLFWAVTGATTFGGNTSFQGNLLDGSTITFGAGVTIEHGRALTGTGTIGLATDTINFIAADSGYSGGLAYVDSGSTITAVPEPATTTLLIAGFSSLFIGIRRFRRRHSAGTAESLG